MGWGWVETGPSASPRLNVRLQVDLEAYKELKKQRPSPLRGGFLIQDKRAVADTGAQMNICSKALAKQL